MSRSIHVLCALILALVLIAAAKPVKMGDLAIPAPGYPAFPGSNSLDDWCYQVGLRSGCSGCTQGAYGLCDFFFLKDYPLTYACISKDHGDEFLAEHRGSWQAGGRFCPENFLEEPPFKSESESMGAVGEKLSTLRSHSYDASYCEFPEQPWPVDRTIYFNMYSDLQENSLNDYCSLVNSRRLNLQGLGTFPVCAMDTEFDKECMEMWGDLLCTTRCPKYGSSFQGLCEDSVKELKRVCSLSNIVGRCVPDASVLDAITVTGNEAIEFCSPIDAIKVSDQFKVDFGFYEECRSTDCEFELVGQSCDASDIADDDCETLPYTVFEFNVIREACGGQTCEVLLQQDAEQAPGEVVDVSCLAGTNECTVTLDLPEEYTECVNEFDCDTGGVDTGTVGWGSHGACGDSAFNYNNGWNSYCEDADECALKACNTLGYTTAVTWTEKRCGEGSAGYNLMSSPDCQASIPYYTSARCDQDSTNGECGCGAMLCVFDLICANPGGPCTP